MQKEAVTRNAVPQVAGRGRAWESPFVLAIRYGKYEATAGLSNGSA